MTRLIISNEGLNALVMGKLKVERDLADDSIAARRFKVAYDSVVINNTEIKFVYDNNCIATLELPALTAADTITVDGLEGKLIVTME